MDCRAVDVLHSEIFVYPIIVGQWFVFCWDEFFPRIGAFFFGRVNDDLYVQVYDSAHG